MNYEELTKGLANEEATDVLMYEKEAALFQEKIIGGEKISDKFRIFAREEASHLEFMSELLPQIKPEPRIIETGKSLRKTLRIHIERETESIKIYNDLLKFPLKSNQVLLIKGIISQEQNHLDTMIKYLRGIEKANE
ncbi:MAG: hypothetical protein HY746_06230 [Elusimicrobia bacterium]|nr:hypothetical protein [Elusimicrobiota bacterium]